ncbi:BaiN/RdsA family NAD(P)/FAD-dependent oxidoreductase [Parerythrobacter jejuensis]|uniref:Aminoacetone oxidase family FAD-binding enzyme n=1 Tax=Parerythrobacter jejuensis TaxID=795812 RepID=A0A845AWK3_9SPHN|nr:NAD(P)/FAD-dependent oxidoreductase [Parerythrobacter jejuensis]MXP31194.1 aminoacetone oxidase family FAD-binding enzyme [Parerythrobacter jejuensis]MXP33954.1 aminoacetone oxidase family FAD-binding enzyme [Parerythrobacter jejuensis]
MSHDAIILGGGAAGLFCAAQAGQRGKRVLVLEKADTVGKKILISGGGRCNFTNIGAKPENFLSANPHFAKSALRRYTARDFLDLVEAHGIAWHEKTLGQLFCDQSAIQIVQMLLDECDKAHASGGHVEILTGQDVSEVVHEGGRYAVMANGTAHTTDSLVIATGGPSIPKMGATDFAYGLARQFGLKVVEPRPALVPLTLGGEDVLFRELSGVATDVVAKAGKTSFAEAALLTHRGLSGPAILQVSSYWTHGDPIHLDFCPGQREGWLLEHKRATPETQLVAILRAYMPERLAKILAERLGLSGVLHSISDKALRRAEQQLARWEFRPNGTEGFAKAEVTAGGISTADLSSQTMEAKAMPGLFAIGEAVDVTGWLGGYNFQWAWSSGWAAGQAI